MHDTDVIIVGAGPVGLGLALELALRGIRVLVLERSTTLHQIPKGQNLTQRSGELFRRWGIADSVRAASPIPRTFGNAGLVTYGSLLSEYHYDWFQRSKVGQYYFAENERLPQYLLEKIMRARLAEFSHVTLSTGCTVTAIEQNDSGVTADYEQDESSHQIAARYLVGCDGSRSTVRRLTDIPTTTRLEGPKMALLVFRSTELDELLSHHPGKSIFNVMNPELNGFWQFLGRFDLDGGWFFHMPVPYGMSADAEIFKRELHRVVGKSFVLDFEHIGFWDLRIIHADYYRSNRVFIAGDAAHSHPPYGGYGVNTGLEDAMNLAWKLSATIKGWGSDALLDSYSEERHAVFDSVSADFIERMIEDFRTFLGSYSPQQDIAAFKKAWQARANADDSDVTEFLPNYAGSSVVWGESGARSSARGKHEVRARAGHHLSPMASGDQAGNQQNDFLRLNHGGFCLLNLDGDSTRASSFQHAFDKREIPLETITEVNSAAIDCYQTNAILVRPDLYVGWTDEGEMFDAHEVLDRLVPINQ